jgi:hypothetical protein
MIFNFLQVICQTIKIMQYWAPLPTLNIIPAVLPTCHFWSPGMWIDLVSQIQIPADFFPWAFMKGELFPEKLASLMELNTTVVQMHQGYRRSIKMCESKYIYLLDGFLTIILCSFCQNISNSQACVVKMLPSFRRSHMLCT